MSAGANLVLSTENAGGNSEKSEALSFEVLKMCFGAELLKTEMEITYYGPGWKKTDFLVSIANHKLGVSVTRAMKFAGLFTEDDAEHLLRKKLHGVNRSTRGVCDGDVWTQQVLHIWSTHAYVTETLRKVYGSERISDELRSNTIVLVTTAEHADFVFFN